MGGTELKTDSLQRWMMYSKDSYGSGRIFLTTGQKQAVEEGKKFARRAYADVWAQDAALVQRVRSFLGTNFHWHQRLAESGADLEVIQTLQSMIRGESVVLIAEQSRTGGAWNDPAPKPKRLPSFREELMTGLGMSYEAATAYMDRYNDMVDEVNAVAARYANGAAASLADAAGDLMEAATPLGDAQPFEYANDPVARLPGEDSQLAWLPRTGGPANTWVDNPSGSGQMRLYDASGNAAVDFDFDHDHGFGSPHVHNWDGNVRDKGNAFSLLPR
ncbi:hypothetical protein [Paraburkholderia phytofirmans]|uniref:Uncharacterized protein n=1 Tax=Paraburkholderia phytofirmans OLGA172 TaxID=1417228 RepID=A0A160FJ56_9BURK|nr:hypothetical protein [Paraburkholderia phytofirmans]ANB71946.1 hypothetical protein AYM40_05835 [Paraburkholderia phytofirmans OLGA172]